MTFGLRTMSPIFPLSHDDYRLQSCLGANEECSNNHHRKHHAPAARGRSHQGPLRLRHRWATIGDSSRSAFGSNISFSSGWISSRAASKLRSFSCSTPAIFLMTVTRIEKAPRRGLLLERARYVVILVAAALLGAYLHANHKDDSY